jgi:hypothetical protein
MESVLLALLLVGIAPSAFAAPYLFVFVAGSAKLSRDLPDNQIALTSLLELLSDFHGAGGFHFVIEGTVPSSCAPASDCDGLLVSRVNSLIDSVDHLGEDARLSRDLSWRRVPEANLPADTLRISVSADAPKPLSPDCPYVLEISDPRLPSSDSHQDWLNVNGIVDIHVTPAAQIRVHTADAAGNLSVKQGVASAERELVASAPRAEWRAGDLLGAAGIAEIRFGNPELTSASVPRKRDVAESSGTWPTGADRETARRLAECDVRLLLRPSR